MLFCRTDKQWREDSLGTKHHTTEKIVISAAALAKMEVTLREGRFCSVWNGKWFKNRDLPAREVAIKQLRSSSSSSSPRVGRTQVSANNCFDIQTTQVLILNISIS